MDFIFGNEDDVRAAIDKAQMSSQEVAHSMEGFIEGLDEEGLRSLRAILSASGSKLTRGYLLGRVVSVASNKYGVCPGCGEKHDEALAKLLGEQPVETQTAQAETITTDEPMQPIMLTDEEKRYMMQYHLDDAYDSESGAFAGFVCTGTDGRGPCGMKYPSIEDRMLRDPDTCGGCIQRAKFG